MTKPTASPSRSSLKDSPLFFVSTNTAIFSDASRTAARSHAAAWSRKRQKEAKAKPKAVEDLVPAADHARTSDDPKLASSYRRLPDQTSKHGSDKIQDSNVQSISRQPEEQLSLSVRSRRSNVKRRNLSLENFFIKGGDLSNLSPTACGKNGAQDPFDSSAVKIDSNTYELLQFYRTSPSMAWDLQPYASNQNTLDGDTGNIVNSCMSSKLHFYTFLSLSAAIMETLGIIKIKTPRATLYSQLALAEMQIQLRSEHIDEQELLHGVSTLSIAAALQGDRVAAQAHLRAAKYLVERLGGFEALMPLIAQRLKYGDFHLAIETLSPPVFELDFELDGFPKQEYSPDPLLEQLGHKALRLSERHLPPYLFENLQQIIQCAEVLEGIWVQPSSSPIKRVEWLASKIRATLSRLLSTTIQTTIGSYSRKAQEATKVILILWHLINLMFAKSVIADTPIRSSMPVFRKSTLEAMREHWPPWIYLGLMSWNDIVRSPSLEYEDRGAFWSLIKVVRSMEAEGLVHLADLMDRLYQLEDIYRTQKRQPEERDFIPR
jgi:hypothetical protein